VSLSYTPSPDLSRLLLNTLASLQSESPYSHLADEKTKTEGGFKVPIASLWQSWFLSPGLASSTTSLLPISGKLTASWCVQ
jgi:hypothetical protein